MVDEHDNKNRKDSQQEHYGKLYGQLPAGSSMLPRWAQLGYIWIISVAVSTFGMWIIMRLTVGAQRGDFGPAMTSFVIGIIVGTVLTVWRWRRTR